MRDYEIFSALLNKIQKAYQNQHIWTDHKPLVDNGQFLTKGKGEVLPPTSAVSGRSDPEPIDARVDRIQTGGQILDFRT